MWQHPEHDQFAGEIYPAGERVESGAYEQIGTGQIFRLSEAGHLPASLDGRIACYMKMFTWAERLGREAQPIPMVA